MIPTTLPKTQSEPPAKAGRPVSVMLKVLEMVSPPQEVPSATAPGTGDAVTIAPASTVDATPPPTQEPPATPPSTNALELPPPAFDVIWDISLEAQEPPAPPLDPYAQALKGVEAKVDEAIARLEAKYYEIGRDAELATALAWLEYRGNTLPNATIGTLVDHAIQRMLAGPMTTFGGAAGSAKELRRLQPKRFDAALDGLIQGGLLLHVMSASSSPKLFANLTALCHARFICELNLTTSADLMLLSTAIDKLILAVRLRANAFQVTPVGPQVKTDAESRKLIELGLKLEQVFVRTITYLQDRHRARGGALHVHAAGGAAVQVNVGQEAPSTPPNKSSAPTSAMK